MRSYNLVYLTARLYPTNSGRLALYSILCYPDTKTVQSHPGHAMQCMPKRLKSKDLSTQTPTISMPSHNLIMRLASHDKVHTPFPDRAVVPVPEHPHTHSPHSATDPPRNVAPHPRIQQAARH